MLNEAGVACGVLPIAFNNVLDFMVGFCFSCLLDITVRLPWLMWPLVSLIGL